MSYPTLDSQRLRLSITGLVQGVGFRPFVYNLARSLNLTGWVQNTPQGVVIEIEGGPELLQAFQQRLTTEPPPHAWLQQIEATPVACQGDAAFHIRPSAHTATKTALILPDLATCPPCLAELWDPQNRRYRYPFINCTHCGPRFSIVRSLPYDRPHTTLAGFPLCPDCQREYQDPGDLRFHAQPNACPTCGPHLELWDAQGHGLADHDGALQQAAETVRQGQVLALKGLGGFHLMVDATNEKAVQRLRQRKHRPTKPLAVMFPSLETLQAHCQVSPEAAALLQSAAAPIVLLPTADPLPQPLSPWERGARSEAACLGSPSPRIGGKGLGDGGQDFNEPIAPAVAPGNPYLGAMLPYTPLHHLLLAAVDRPVVATSGNRSGEPICIDEQDALERLGEISDLFLIHNRPIARPVDDSIVQMVRGQPVLLRRARGYGPMPIPHPAPARTDASERADQNPSPSGKGDALSLSKGAEVKTSPTILAVGGHLKNTVALHHQGQTLLSPHLGDLDTVPGRDRFQAMIYHLCNLYDLAPSQVSAIAHDAHPDYASTQWAKTLTAGSAGPRLISVQHHYAHAMACMAENQWQPPVLGLAWDGTGYGLDGTLWGGEVLWIPRENAPTEGFERAAHVKPFPLPGGDRAAREPRRAALGLLYGCWGERAFTEPPPGLHAAFTPQEFQLLQQMLVRGVNTPRTSSMGRLFDGVASLLGLCQRASFEGEAAMALEFAIADCQTDATYPYGITTGANGLIQFDPAPMVTALLQAHQRQVPTSRIAATFHNTVIAGFGEIIHHLREHHADLKQVVLTGGCFQNRHLLERAIVHLEAMDFKVGWHHQFPSNDGGIALGQVSAGLNSLNNSKVAKSA